MSKISELSDGGNIQNGDVLIAVRAGGNVKVSYPITATTTELNYVDGVTSPIQTQLNAKAPIDGATFTGTTTIPTADINGGTIDGTVIGGSTAAAGNFTTVTASSKFGIIGNGASPTVSALEIGTNGVGTRLLYNVPTGGEHNFTENGTVLSWQNLSSLGWLISGAEQMRLTSTGLGIGTSSPTQKLDVNGSIKASGIYLGGTGAANHLDSYEEGTFLPTVIGGSSAGVATYRVYRNGYYTKIGNLVSISLIVGISDHTGGGALLISGLPFPNAGTFTAVSLGEYTVAVPSGETLTATITPSENFIRFQRVTNGGSNSVAVELGLDPDFTYIIAAATYQVA